MTPSIILTNVMIWGEGLQMPTIMVTTNSIMKIHQTTEVKPTPTCETSSHLIYTYLLTYSME